MRGNCRAGLEQYCLNGFTDTCNGIDRDGSVTQGGYSTHLVVDERFVLCIPEAISFEKAAPLLCAGITPVRSGRDFRRFGRRRRRGRCRW
jgi:uncharacterized zinc-type alcohol dehydrogenase-like protein